MKYGLIGATAALALGAFATATTASASDIKGIGSVVCSQFNTNWANFSEAQREDVRIGIHQWAFGYFSGRNVQQPSQARDLTNLNINDTADYIIGECSYYPDARIFQIANTIYNNLPYDGPGV